MQSLEKVCEALRKCDCESVPKILCVLHRMGFVFCSCLCLVSVNVCMCVCDREKERDKNAVNKNFRKNVKHKIRVNFCCFSVQLVKLRVKYEIRVTF
jgi:hypothetical protein